MSSPRPASNRPAARLVALVVTLTIGLTLAACSGGRVSADDLEAGLTTSGSLFPVAEQQAPCAADLLVKSDVSDDALRAVADADGDAEISAEDSSALAAVLVDVLRTCTE